MIITYTPAQAQYIVNEWNALANDDNQLTAEQAYLVLHDNSDYEMTVDGVTFIEVGPFASRSGNPETFYILAEDVTCTMDGGAGN